jgi:hypothetical protein
MGHILYNALKFANAAGGSPDSLKLDQAPDLMQFDGLRLNISMPVTVTGTPTLVQSDLVLFLKRAIGTFTLEEQVRGAVRTLWNAADGNDLRTAHRWWARNEVVNNVVGAQSAGAATFTATVFLPFVAPPWLRAYGSRRPGTSQVRRLMIRAAEGLSALPASIARAAGNCQVEVEFIVQPGPDQFAAILSMQREQSPRRDAVGPDGVTLLAYVPDTAAASSALTGFNVQVIDGASAIRVTDLQSIAPITRAYDDAHKDVGSTSITDEHTVVYFADDQAELDKVPHGSVRFEEYKTDLSPVNLRFLYLPSRDATRAKAEAKAAADAKGGSVLLAQPIIDDDADPGAAAVQAARIFEPSDARFTTRPGLLAWSGSDVVSVSMPPSIVGSVKAQAAAAKGAGPNVARDVARRGIKVARAFGDVA